MEKIYSFSLSFLLSSSSTMYHLSYVIGYCGVKSDDGTLWLVVQKTTVLLFEQCNLLPYFCQILLTIFQKIRRY